ncbi:MAG: site-specific integrase [Anaerolineae bacterium]|nr:site-specific integrase [Anaerolineae bacterium]
MDGKDTPQATMALSAQASLRTAVEAFQGYMHQRNFSAHTVDAFNSDLQILAEFIGVGTAIDQIGTRDLNSFVHWLTHDRGVPCNPKSLARRVTTLKVFFGWLAETNVLAEDPSAPVIHKPVMTPLPEALSDEDVERALAVTQALRRGEHPDARPHLLFTLLLHTGIKKGECMGIVVNHVDLSDPEKPFLWIRYADPRHRHKERKLLLPADWPAVLAEYRTQYELHQTLFPWTARNLEYILADVAAQAGLSDGLSFKMLRWTCAVRDYKAGMDANRLRQKLGLSRISWREAGPKIAKLAGEPL